MQDLLSLIFIRNISLNIYTKSFTPTYLYIKQHSVTCLLYFGKTYQDPTKYLGSGKYWKRHIKKHGKEFVEHMWDKLFTNKDDLVNYALDFSIRNNIVESDDWANLKPENGLDGNPLGVVFSEEAKINMGNSHRGSKHSEEAKHKMSESAKGRPKSEETRMRMVQAKKSISEETRKKLSETKIGIPRRKTICPHCSKEGGENNMGRYHFDNCKSIQSSSTSSSSDISDAQIGQHVISSTT